MEVSIVNAAPSVPSTSLAREVVAYASQVRSFGRQDWLVYAAWVGMMLGLLVSVAGFVLGGWRAGVRFPGYVWSIPIGTAIFVGAIAFDTIGHRTAYKEVLKEGEALVHQITIFAGVTSVLALCLAYDHREVMRFPALSLIALSIFYSVVDEALHWRRYLTSRSDRVEMWSHFFIFLGHTMMILSWWHWYDQGYPGVADTLVALFGR
jgi:hypothetical protein